ncbi:methionyl-tRNA formyltransferase, mitochondrial isoform X1 [Vanessa cardui]|uniref:methionyl-tRNA formyltransferase, mitochondrial isoform X1 n=1 Tax=Vanessa cardui TaxID=171605 RepID=UPI001F139CC0|nr:methionyl-tRNA formyltransferase, mitochondrial isoform X1 [Vanessa cardui]
MTAKVHNRLQILPKLFMKEKCYYFHKIHYRTYYKVLFFGSDLISLKSLQRVNQFKKSENLIKQLDLVTANSSKNKTLIEKYAQMENIKLLQWPNLNINHNEYDIGVIVAFGHLIKDDILNKFPLGMVNVHPSLLPRWRGAAPIIHTLLHGDEIGGVSLMKIKPNIFDVGEIISQQEVPISKDIKLPELTEQLSDIGANMLVECLRTLPECLTKAKPQNEEGVTYAKKIHKEISEVRWSDMTSREVYNLYRAIYGLYPLTTKFRDKQMKLFHAFLIENDPEYTNKSVGSLEYCENTKAIRILCKDKRFIYFKTLRILGKREISALDFYNGYIKNVALDVRKSVIC